MYILKNAWISITRNKSRNILIGVIILVIASAVTITLAINNTANDLINSYESAYDKELSISFNREKMMEDVGFSNREKLDDAKDKFDNIESYTIEDVVEFSKNEHIESYYYTYEISLNGNNIEKVESDMPSDKRGFEPGGGEFEPNNSSLDFTLTGYNAISSMSEFIEGKYQMSDILDNAWELAFEGNYVFINEELASYNNLSLNDKIKLEDTNGNTYEFEIIGIFKENSESENMSMFSSSANTIITNADALVKITSENESVKGQITPKFIIDSYESTEEIENYFYEMGLNEAYSVKTNEEEANAGLTSIQNVKSFSTTFLVITLIIGGIVLFVINMINIRERKYEIGVLRTIGMSKLKLTLQFMSELALVSLAALLIGAGIGAVVSKNVSNQLLSSEIESSKNNEEQIKNNFGGEMPSDIQKPSDNKMPGQGFDKMNNMPSVSAYDSIDAVVSVKVILELLGIGLILVLVSSSAAMISIQRFSPLTILKERS